MPPKQRKKKTFKRVQEVTLLEKVAAKLGYKTKRYKDIEGERLERERILARQRYLEEKDVSPQVWNFVFGDDTPKKNKDIFQIVNVTPRNIWMEENFIYNQIKKFKPLETFHSPEVYTLKWQPPKCPFRLMIPLHDLQLQENVAIDIANMSEDECEKILFYFSPTDPLVPLFAPRINPEALKSYRTSAALLRKLCDQYLDSKITLPDLEQVLLCEMDVWKLTVYNLMNPSEKPYHKYLTEKTPPPMTLARMAKKYENHEISLQDFSDYKYPDRKRLKEIESLEYPRPYTLTDCVICLGKNIATIKCQNCQNKVCKDCMERCFLDEVTKVGSFLYMHRMFCMRRGRANSLLIPPDPETPYLTDLKRTGRKAIATEFLNEAAERVRLLYAEEELPEDDGYDSEEERRKLELEKLAREPPIFPELHSITLSLAHLSKLCRKAVTDILNTQANIDRTRIKSRRSGHTTYGNRLEMSKQGRMDQMVAEVRIPLEELQLRLQHNIPADVLEIAKNASLYAGVEKEISTMMRTLDLIVNMSNGAEYFAGVDAMAAEEEERIRKEEERKKADHLLSFSAKVGF